MSCQTDWMENVKYCMILFTCCCFINGARELMMVFFLLITNVRSPELFQIRLFAITQPDIQHDVTIQIPSCHPHIHTHTHIHTNLSHL